MDRAHRRARDRARRSTVEPGPTLAVPGDPDQLDQLLINLRPQRRRGAAPRPAAASRIAWTRRRRQRRRSSIEDEGHGVADTANLFVPFFTTKPNGSGIGLVLARQIAEAHGGSLVVRNRKSARGAEAVITLPIRAAGIARLVTRRVP